MKIHSKRAVYKPVTSNDIHTETDGQTMGLSARKIKNTDIVCGRNIGLCRAIFVTPTKELSFEI
jgi:hypothetical protein